MTIHRHHNVYLADTARVRGEVALGENVNLWYGAVIRGDVAPVTIGANTNVQDNAVVHCDSDVPNAIGRDVTIGHAALVHGRSVGDRTLIGMHATVLGGTVIGADCLVAAGTLVPPGLEVPDGMLVMGVPGRIVKPITDEQRDYLHWLARHYVELARHHHQNPDAATTREWSGNRG